MEEEKKEGLENIEGQRRLPPRPMPPRPPLMKKQIVVEGEQEEKKVEEKTEEPVVEEKVEEVPAEEKSEEKKPKGPHNYRVVYDKEEKIWKLRKDGAKRVIKSFATKISIFTVRNSLMQL